MANSPSRPSPGFSLNLRVNHALADSIFDLADETHMSRNKVSNMLLEIGYQYVQAECNGSIYQGMADVQKWIIDMYGTEDGAKGVDSAPDRG